MKCYKCGNELDDQDVFCTNCGAQRPVEIQPTVPTQVVYQQPTQQLPNYQVVVPQTPVQSLDKKNANALCIISLLLYFLGPIIAGILSIMISVISENLTLVTAALSVISRIAAFVMAIVARIKYPNSTFAKILLWIYIAFILSSVLMIILLIILIVIGIMSISNGW